MWVGVVSEEAVLIIEENLRVVHRAGVTLGDTDYDVDARLPCGLSQVVYRVAWNLKAVMVPLLE